MSTTTQYKDFSDLYTGLLNRVREGTSATATVEQSKRYINIGLQDMHIGYGEKFPWAERKGRLTTQAPYSTGTVSIAKGSSTLTGSGTAWNTNNAFAVKNARNTGHIIIAGQDAIYDVFSVGSDTAITLSSPYVGDPQTAASYVYFEDEYDLDADFLRPLDWQFFDARRSIQIMDRMAFRRKFARNGTPGKLLAACIVDRAFSGNTTPIRRVEFVNTPDAAYSVPYSFVTNKLAISSAGVAAQSLSADTDEPIVPFQYRHAILMHALYHWYRDKKDDARSAEVKGEFVDLILRITGDTEIGERRPVLQPVMGAYRRRARSPYSSGRMGGYTTGSRFDRLEE